MYTILSRALQPASGFEKLRSAALHIGACKQSPFVAAVYRHPCPA